MSTRGRFRSGVFSAPFYPVEENTTLAIRRELELVEWLDRLDYDEAWIGEHHSGGFEIIASPELLIAAAAERTKKIRLGTGVVSLPYHNPLTVAARIAQLDHMTQGRVMFGVGPGALVTDAKMLGIDPDLLRGRLMESLEAITRLLNGETVTMSTDWFQLVGARLNIEPYSKPYPEIAVASTFSPSGSRAAGRFGLSMLCLGALQIEGVDALEVNWRLANELAAENGLSLDAADLRVTGPIHIAKTREAARENVRFGLEKWLDYFVSIAPGMKARVQGLDPIAAVETAYGAVIGTPDDAVVRIEALRGKVDFGCFLHFAHHWADWEETKASYELYARFVLPRLRKSDGQRQQSLALMRSRSDEIVAALASSRKAIFEQHAAERAGARPKGSPG